LICEKSISTKATQIKTCFDGKNFANISLSNLNLSKLFPKVYNFYILPIISLSVYLFISLSVYQFKKFKKFREVRRPAKTLFLQPVRLEFFFFFFWLFSFSFSKGLQFKNIFNGGGINEKSQQSQK